MSGASRGQKSKVSKITRVFGSAGALCSTACDVSNYLKTKKGLYCPRIHTRFLHSNATSHRSPLGGFAELIDNSVDEIINGCTYAIVNVLHMDLKEEEQPVISVEDNGGGMNPDQLRNCLSFGFSDKDSKEMIGQYGNGFKTSTMRLGADALVLTKSATAQTCSIGLLSYTFLTETHSQDVLVPIIDYNLQDRSRLTQGDEVKWKSKMDIICEWGPFSSEAEIWSQLDSMPVQGTRVYIWNLWQTSDDILELDFDTDSQDIRLRGSDEEIQDASNRKKRADEGIKRCHAYKHSLRAYVSLLYLEWPEGFQVTLRGKEIQPIPVTEGMKHVAMYDYRPRSLPKEDANSNELKGIVSVPVYIGFAIEAPETSVSGFCVYHRNRLIKPFWKCYKSLSNIIGEGVIGYLQADFLEPTHDKQDFNITPTLQKLEKYLKKKIPNYYKENSSLIGYQVQNPLHNDAGITEDALFDDSSYQPHNKSEKQTRRIGTMQKNTSRSCSIDSCAINESKTQKVIIDYFQNVQNDLLILQNDLLNFSKKRKFNQEMNEELEGILNQNGSRMLKHVRKMKWTCLSFVEEASTRFKKPITKTDTQSVGKTHSLLADEEDSINCS